VHVQGTNGFGNDAGKGATPAGVDGGDGPFFVVDEEDGDAIGGLDGEEEARAVGDGGVAAAGVGGRGVEEMDDVGMELFERDQGEAGGAESGLEAAAIFEDVFAGVPVGEAEVEDFFGFKGGDAAGAGGEAVEEEGEFGEGGDLEELKLVQPEGAPRTGPGLPA
jgi:hypothetical protein